MEKEKGPGGEQNLNMLLKKALEEIDAVHGNEVYVGEVYNARNRYREACIKEGEAFYEKINDVKTLIKTGTSPKDPIIRGLAEIAEGGDLILVINPDQKDAFVIVYDMDLDSKVPYYASVENAAGESKVAKEVLIKFCGLKPASVNHLIVSKALAKELQVEKGQNIKILSIRQEETSKINLDKI